MALICETITTYIEQEVVEKVENWVSTKTEQCRRRKWWDPRSWFCWFVYITVLVVSWVAKKIVLKIEEIVCKIVVTIIGTIIWPFGAAIDAICPKCRASAWIVKWFISPKITPVSERPNAIDPAFTDYIFKCRCKNGDHEISVTASNQSDAVEMAKKECKKVCGH